MKYTIETMSNLTPKTWSIVPETLRNSKPLESFKLKTRKCNPECSCRLYRVYLKGFFT